MMQFAHSWYLWLIGFATLLLFWKWATRPKRLLVPWLGLWHTPTLQAKWVNRLRSPYAEAVFWWLCACLLLVGIAQPFSLKKQPHWIILLDNSMSMLVQEDHGARWDKAKELLHRYIGQAGLDRITFVLTAPNAHWTTGYGWELMQVQQQRGSIKEAAELAVSLCAEPYQLAVVTDGADENWNTMLPWLVQQCPTAQIHIVGQTDQNLGIMIQHIDQGTPWECKVKITNASQTHQENQLCWSWQEANGLEQHGRIDIVLKPLEQTTETIQWMPQLSQGKLRCWLQKSDVFLLDDVAECIIGVLKLRVLLVSQTPQPHVLAALASYPELVDQENSSWCKTLEQISQDHAYDLIILMNPEERCSLPVGKFLIWGTIWPEIAPYLKERSENPKIWKWNSNHPLLEDIDFSFLTIRRAWNCTLAANQIASGNAGSLIAEIHFGDANCIYIAFSLADSNWQFLASFPILVYNVMVWATQPNAQNANFQIVHVPGTQSRIAPLAWNASMQPDQPSAEIREYYNSSYTQLVFILILMKSFYRMKKCKKIS